MGLVVFSSAWVGVKNGPLEAGILELVSVASVSQKRNTGSRLMRRDGLWLGMWLETQPGLEVWSYSRAKQSHWKISGWGARRSNVALGDVLVIFKNSFKIVVMLSSPYN